MQTYSDEYIEHWAGVYLTTETVKNSIDFECFLKSPESIIETIGTTEKLQASLDELDNLLPILKRDDVNDDEAMQEEMDKRFERQGHVVEMHGNKNIEKFYHHECPKKWKTNTRVKTGGAS